MNNYHHVLIPNILKNIVKEIDKERIISLFMCKSKINKNKINKICDNKKNKNF